jgi:hypothetical protein
MTATDISRRISGAVHKPGISVLPRVRHKKSEDFAGQQNAGFTPAMCRLKISIFEKATVQAGQFFRSQLNIRRAKILFQTV